MEQEPERGGRCLRCFKLRLLETARYAHEHGLSVITTTLASSRWKSLEQINEAGQYATASYPEMCIRDRFNTLSIPFLEEIRMGPGGRPVFI